MSRNYQLFIEDIQMSCEKIVRYTKGLTVEQFLADDKTFDAVVRNLTVIGEAVKHIPQDVRERHPLVEWRRDSRFSRHCRS